MGVLSNILSVKNSSDDKYKIWTVLGIKIKFSRKDWMIAQTYRLALENKETLSKIQKRLFMLDVPLNYKKYWTDDNMQNVIPLGYGDFPEGFHPGELIRDILKDIPYNKILDFGCAYGRLSRAFDPEKYIGIDLNPNALKKARENNPDYTYIEIDVNSEYPGCDVAFAHTVFLHNDDETLLSILKRLKKAGCKYIVVSDVMSKDFHNGFIPPTYHRSLDDYNKLMSEAGFSFVSETKRIYKRYKEDERYKDKNSDLSFLLYKSV